MSGRRWVLSAIAVIVGATGGTALALAERPLPALAVTDHVVAASPVGAAPTLPWPATGSAALRVAGLGWLGQTPAAAPRPMASTAKIMTALLLLEDHPLSVNEPGPVVTITPADVAAYRRDVALDESSVAVVVGERLSELQLLQGLLIPSAGNFADLLAALDAGSIPAFVQRMNQRAAALGMRQTIYDDPTGFDPGTVSVPADLVLVAETALQLPVFAQIVGQPSVALPLVGLLHSTDHILGQAGIVGVKTGHTNEAGGNFVFAALVQVGGHPVRLDGAVMNQPSLDGAFAVTLALIRAVTPHLLVTPAVASTDQVATIRAAWHAQTSVHPAGSVTLLAFDGMAVQRRLHLNPVAAPLPSRTVVGWLTVELGEQRSDLPVETDAALALPGPFWRIFRR